MLRCMWEFLKSLNFIDYVLFFTVLFLIVLIVCLIYFIKVNEEEMKKDDLVDPDNLKKIAASIKKESKPINFTSFEKEQEESAIISYDELLSNTGQFSLNYLEDENKSDLDVKMVDLNNLINVNEISNDTCKINAHVISLKREEEFLKALKELKKLLN